MPILALWIVLANLSLKTLFVAEAKPASTGYTITAPSPIHKNNPANNSGKVQQSRPPADFERFYAQLRSAIRRQDQSALRELMSPSFEWALDGYTSRDQALLNVGQTIGWQNFWQGASLAVAKPARICSPSYCNNRAGYETATKTPIPLEMVFELSADHHWHWTALPGD
jgi:hypothetical protein